MVINFDRVYAITISINSPQTVKIGEEFNVEINADTNEIHDVKIFAYTGDIRRPNYASEIYDGTKWRSPHNYIRAAFPAQKIFRIRANGPEGEFELCVRMRKINASSYSQKCTRINFANIINVLENNSRIIQTENLLRTTDHSNYSSQVQEDFFPLNEEKDFRKDNEYKKIVLGEVKEYKKTDYKSPESILRKWMLILFVVISLTIIILMALRKFS